jgi:hypothetical protein
MQAEAELKPSRRRNEPTCGAPVARSAVWVGPLSHNGYPRRWSEDRAEGSQAISPIHVPSGLGFYSLTTRSQDLPWLTPRDARLVIRIGSQHVLIKIRAYAARETYDHAFGLQVEHLVE